MSAIRRAVVAASCVAVLAAGCSDGPAAAPPGSASPPVAGGSPTTDGPKVVVEGSSDRHRVNAYRAQTRIGLGQVTQVWGTDWTGRTVRVMVTETGEEFAGLTGRPADGSVPAVTTSQGVVVVHPDLWTSTPAQGRQLVVTHELTHVALGQGSVSGVPLWVIEGSAELTAYRASGLRPRAAAPSLFRLIGAGTPPSGPPIDADLQPTTRGATPLGYQRAWAWCSFLVQRRGLEAFTAFVRQADAGRAGAFEATYGASPAALAQDYRTWLRGWS